MRLASPSCPWKLYKALYISLSEAADRAGGGGGGSGAARGVALVAPFIAGAAGLGTFADTGVAAARDVAEAGATATAIPAGAAGFRAPGKALAVGLDLAARA